MKRSIDRLVFYCDPISPYTYFASHFLPSIAGVHELPIVIKPVLFAGLINASGAKGPAEIPPRRKYLFLDCMRIARQAGLPFAMPPKHPFNPLLALRTLTAVESDAQRLQAFSSLATACWGRGEDLTDPAAVSKALTAAGLDAAALLSAANTEAVKLQLRRNTDDAIAAGVFGVPTISAGGELFWGSDRLHHLDAFLDDELTIDHAQLEKMIDIPRGADRKAFRPAT